MRAMTIAALAAACLGFGTASQAVVVGQIDTFDGPSLMGWFAGNGPNGQVPPTPPQAMAGGGPGGAADPFMQVTAVGGDGAGSRLVAMNAAQWAGDYLAAGVTALGMDVRNLGTSDLVLRLLFEDPIPGPPQNAAVSSTGVALPAGSDWTHVVFPVSVADLTAIAGSAADALGGTTVLRLFHSAATAFPGESIAALLGVDNIQAIGPVTPVPAPATAWLAIAALAALAGGRRRPAGG